jgi:protein SCO1/2
MFLSPTGLVSRYIYGLNYYPRDIKFALIEASEGRVGSSVDKIIMSCFHYDPTKGSYVPFAWGVMRLGAAIAVLALGSMIFVLRRREKHSAAPSA